MSVAISWDNKMQLAKCDIMVGFPISSHICKTHYGHQSSLGHLRLQKCQREAIASQLAQGITPQHALDRIRDSVYEKFERIHLLTKKDIRNVERSFGLCGNE